MTDLRIADAPELTAAELNDSLKVPTGGFGNYSITLITIRDWLLNYKMFATQTYVDTKVGVVTTALNAHTGRIDNPHQVTKFQLGLGNVDNTSDINKPVSAATQTALTNLNTSLTSAISVKANTSDVYAKSEVYTKVESDGKYHQKLSIDGILAPTAVFDDVKNIDGVNGTPDSIINQPIQNLANRTEYLKTHNNLVGRSSANSHPSEAISYGNITQKKYNDGVESVAELLAIQNPFQGMRVYVKSYHTGLKKGGGWYIFDESRSGNTDDILNINGWLLQHNKTLNLRSCGLKGDEVSDDRPALQKAVRVASAHKLKLIGNPADIYLINSLSNESGTIDLIWCNTNYFDLDLNGATIKIASGLGDYRTIFAAGWIHTKFKLYNGIIDQNTVNNPPQSPVLWSNTNGQRNIVAAYSVPHEYFEVSNIKMLDALGVWEINTTQAKRVYICNNEVHYSSVAVTHTDKTSFYVLPRQWADVNQNKFYGDTYGNATTAVELHGSNCEFKNNTVVGFRSPVFVTPNAQEDNNPVLQNMYVRDNNFVSCQNGVLIWVESSADLNRPIENVHITGNKVLIDSRLITTKDMGLTNGTGVGFLGLDEDCVIDGLYIQDNKINYNYNPENIGENTKAGIDLTSFMPNAAFKWSNIYVQDNIIENAPCNGIAIGNTVIGPHTSSIDNVLISGNNVLNCGVGQFDVNSYAVKVHNPSKLSKIRVTDNTFSETVDAGITFMKFVSIDVGDNSAVSGVRTYDNETSFSRDTSINDMYNVRDILVNDLRKNHLNHNDTNTKAKYGSTFKDISTGVTIVQSSLDANTPLWKNVTY